MSFSTMTISIRGSLGTLSINGTRSSAVMLSVAVIVILIVIILSVGFYLLLGLMS
jgi:hypothetical protein